MAITTDHASLFHTWSLYQWLYYAFMHIGMHMFVQLQVSVRTIIMYILRHSIPAVIAPMYTWDSYGHVELSKLLSHLT